jgi:hypothetical protein
MIFANETEQLIENIELAQNEKDLEDLINSSTILTERFKKNINELCWYSMTFVAQKKRTILLIKRRFNLI